MNDSDRAAAIDRFLRTGDHDPLFLEWPGQDIIEMGRRGRAALIDALLAELRRREARVEVPREPQVPHGDHVALTRSKVEPMVRGLFPRAEQDPVLSLLERSIVFVTPATVEPLIRNAGFASTSRSVADLYLTSIGGEPFDTEMPPVVGMTVGETCYVSLEYFTEGAPFADWVVHEAAHFFHNTKRQLVGLRETRRREHLLEIEFARRETFAYACEAYSRILALGSTPAERRELLEELAAEWDSPDERADTRECLELVTEAVGRRNGWKAILGRCVEGATRGEA